MPPPEEPPRDDAFSDSDQAWYDRLGPGPHPPARNAAEQEGDRLRDALRVAGDRMEQQPEVQAAMSDEAAERRWQRLQARLDEAGLLMPDAQASPGPAAAAPGPAAGTPAAAPARPRSARPGRWQGLVDAVRGTLLGPRWPAAAGLALVLALGTVVIVRMQSEPAVIYGRESELKGLDDVREVAVAQPRQAAESFAAELRAAGLQPGLFQRGRTFIVDIDVAREQFVAATPAFQRIGLQPRLGFTRVEFGPAQAR